MISLLAESLDEAQAYRLLTGLVVPRPIALVSTVSAQGVRNLAPFSFFNALAVTPPVLGISIGRRGGRDVKDTLANICETKEFVVNLVDEALAEQMNTASLDWPSWVDEFAASGARAVPENLVVRPPRVAGSPAQFECRPIQMIEFTKDTLVLGEVVAIHVRDDLLGADGRVDQGNLLLIGRLAGPTYCRTGDRFTLHRDADSPDRRAIATAATLE